MIVFDNVTVKKGEKMIIENVHTVIDDSDRVLIFARNGAGKSSLIKSLVGLEQVEGGAINYHKYGSQVKRNEMVLSYLPELYEFDEQITVNQLYKGFYLANIVNRTVVEVSFIDRIYKTLELKKLENQQFGTLSKGEKKRLLLAISLMVKYDYLILDEPYDGLDSEWRKTIAELIVLSAHQMDSPVNIIISSHIYDKTTDVNCNKILTIENKRVEVKES